MLDICGIKLLIFFYWICIRVFIVAYNLSTITDHLISQHSEKELSWKVEQRQQTWPGIKSCSVLKRDGSK